MNLLVTNTHNAQAYAIIRALRPHARKIVATMEGDNRLSAWFSHAARSRLVDKRYFTPSPAADWKAGKIQMENTEIEESYIQAILRICEEEKIDTIFPSFDPHVGVFAKNKEKFEKIGVLIPIPAYETVLTPLDKYRTIRAAEKVGFPCPKTYLSERQSDLCKISEEIGFPVVIKPRFSAGGRGLEIVKNLPELTEKTRVIGEAQGAPLIQEFIPGDRKQMFHMVLDKKGQVKAVFNSKRLRTFARINPHLPTAQESALPHSNVELSAHLLQHLGWWGGATVQTKVDSRDGIAKLMEVNPRIGYRLWTRTELGINEPLICLKIARGESIEGLQECPVGTLLLNPIEDLVGLKFKLMDLLVYNLRVGLLGKAPLDPSNPPMSIDEIVKSYKESYLTGKKKIFDPYFRYFFQDPVVSMLWWAQFFRIASGELKYIGR